MLGIQDAEHAETAPDASTLVISRLTCSLVGKTETVRIMPDTLAHRAFGKDETIEEFRCNYGLNPEYRERFGSGALCISGQDANGEVRIFELQDRRFFVGTLFLPQLSSSPAAPHPLILAYLKAAILRTANAHY